MIASAPSEMRTVRTMPEPESGVLNAELEDAEELWGSLRLILGFVRLILLAWLILSVQFFDGARFLGRPMPTMAVIIGVPGILLLSALMVGGDGAIRRRRQ